MNRLNEQDTQTLANLLCQKWALDLDAGDKSSTQIIIEMLSDLPIKVAWQLVRKNIGIERCVKNDLDEDKNFQLLNQKVKEIPEVQDKACRDDIFDIRINGD